MKLWGNDYSRQELESLTGDLRQIADIEMQTRSDGPESGVRQAHVKTGGGLEFSVHLDRGIDLGQASFRGIPLTWHSPVGTAHPHRAEMDGMGWLRTFPGGLLSLCGLSNAGPPSVDLVGGAPVGLHGRIWAAQARNVATESLWVDGEWKLRLRARVEEAALFRHRLSLERTLEIVPGVPGFRLFDTVRNFGGSPAPLMMLYHCNFGWPFLSQDTRIVSPAERVEPRDAEAASGLDQWSRIGPPKADFREQVFFHHLPPGNPMAVFIENRVLGIRVEIGFHSAELSHLTQWKQGGWGDYVLGIEPGNCPPIGQAEAQRQGCLPWIQPGEEKKFSLEFLCRSLN